MSNPARKSHQRSILVIGIFLISFLASKGLYAQTKLDSVRYSKRIYISYGGVFTGNGDMWGHKLYLGANFMLSDRLGLDFNVGGALIDHVFYEHNNPEWSRNEISNGLEFSANGMLYLSKPKVRFSATIGPTIRYGYDQFSTEYGIDYNPDTNEYDWHVIYEENQGIKFGGNMSLTFDFRLLDRIYLGPKASMSFFPFDAYRFSYIGLNLTWK
jgi:hypothetical protein